MCGIVGAINGGTVINDLLSGLHRVEYRGYDSAGVAILHNQEIARRRAEGKLNQLEELLFKAPLDGAAGIGHTRWATHGMPCVANAHPHATAQVAVVHNGIIENFKDIREQLTADGHVFESETDTEVIPHLITHYLAKGMSPEAAVQEAIEKLRGAYALGVLMRDDPDHLYAARKGSPLVLGKAEHGAYLASDSIALSEKASELIFLQEGDMAVLGRDQIEITDICHRKVKRKVATRTTTNAACDKNGYAHYMLKEIHEQPDAVEKTVQANANALYDSALDFSDLSRLTIVACGTSFYAASVAKYWFEKYADLPVETDIASEFRYRSPYMPQNGAALFISQSGETADTLAALRYAKDQEQKIISLVNVADSSIAREADYVFHTMAGTEIGVASTKAFTTQLTLLALIALQAGQQRGVLSHDKAMKLTQELDELPQAMKRLLTCDSDTRHVAQELERASNALFIGRNTSFPIAMEGALKLKEISYIHAEGFGAGELKHGPIALVEQDTPVISLLPKDSLYEKTLSNIYEVEARGAQIITVGPEPIDGFLHIDVDDIGEFCNPILYALPMQLLAYHTAVVRGTNVDQPRNLAKSVTVE
ncbi:glutamine--fructose-6-phosphate transaminase (isomerizing) [Terasakiella sp. SH-1]|uniref:glutamine--fructose-6-phosphate transaminase (isomerizing) n=1 Tax=Terasakiella sp. SH-1 TaxID=2560057 RepID=UPI0010734CDA|nr:glutamine--fructose-6-phosphate transaminase (isomerizing) [Terasakiella sp. SH-1]